MTYPEHIRRMLLVEIEKAQKWCESDDATSAEYRQGYLSGLQQALNAVDDMNKRILALLDLALRTDDADRNSTSHPSA